MLKRIICSICACFVKIAFGQVAGVSTLNNSLKVDFGINQLKEENLHPKVHTGFITGLNYSHRLKTKFFSEYSIQARYSRVKTGYEDLSASVNLQLEVHYNRLLHGYTSERFEYLLGPEIGLAYNVGYYPNWDDSHLYWTNSISLNLANRATYSLSEKKSLIGMLSISAFPVFNRPQKDRQYKIDDITFGGILNGLNSHFEPGFPGKLLKLQLRFEYKINFTKRLSESIYYRYEYERANGAESNLFGQSIHGVGVKLYF